MNYASSFLLVMPRKKEQSIFGLENFFYLMSAICLFRILPVHNKANKHYIKKS